MRIIQVNNSAETFTTTASGAIATHIWEVCLQASNSSYKPLVVTQSTEEPALPGVELAKVPSWSKPVPDWNNLFRRISRRVSGWREVEHKKHAQNVVRLVRHRGLLRGRFLLHNDPEMAVVLKKEFPQARIIHHFHNPVKARSTFLRSFRDSVDAVTAVSNFVASEIRGIYGIKAVKVVYNGVDLERFRPICRKPNDVVTINFLGRTGIEKAPDLLLRAALILASQGVRLRVQLIGSNHWGRWESDEYQSELKRLGGALKDLGVEVISTGHVKRADVPAALVAADVHVLPSRWEEPCALSLLEGMASGLAVIASRTGGTPEIMGHAGRLFSKDNLEELTENLRDLIYDQHERHKLAVQARARAEEFTWRRCWDGFSMLLD